MESKKLQTDASSVVYGNAITAATARIAHELMDPARKKPETPMEHEQREVIRKLVEAIHDECAEYGGYLLPTFKALDAAAPYLQED